MSRTLIWLLLCCTLLACKNTRDSRLAPMLIERQFLLQSQSAAPLLQGSTVRLGFTKRELSFGADCNHLFGEYSVSRGKIAMHGIGKTEMGCGREGQARDAWLAEFFLAGPRLLLEGNTLTLVSGKARLVFLDRVVADPDRPLQGTPWDVTMYIDKGQDVAMGLFGISVPKLLFTADGAWHVRTTCGDGEGRYTAEAERLTITGASFSAHPCELENDQIAARFVRSVLSDGELRYRIRAGALSLENSTHGLELRDPR